MYSISYKEPGINNQARFEKIHVEIAKNSNIGSIAVAEEIANLIKDKAAKGQTAVLGLTTGSSPLKIYEELVRMHKEEGLSFHNVVTFNTDEYYDLDKESQSSFHSFMNENLFKYIDILPDNINIPDGNIPSDKIEEYCSDYEMKIKSYGGIDYQILCIGRTGHIGFNEPGSHINSKTRLITLDHVTRSDSSFKFHGLENVPRRAITMGVGTILKAKRVVLVAWGDKKAGIIKEAVEKDMSPEVPASYLQTHKNATIVVDEAAAEELTRQKTPWIVGNCLWNEQLEKKGVVWLSKKLDKPILKLTDRDYNDNFMSSLLSHERNSAYSLNLKMFNILQHTITGWPGGKPDADDSARPERKEPAKKRVIVFSPHPDDAVICMGGTIRRLVEQGHDVHLVIMTSGSVAVGSKDALRFVELAEEFYQFQTGEKTPDMVFNSVIDFLKTKKDDQADPKAVSKLKTLIRKGEAIASTRFIGIEDKNVHFLDLPFYETGTAKKTPITKKDIDKVIQIIKELKPHQIFAAGDLDDPHGTQKICMDIIISALSNLKTENFYKECWLWLYRGAWSEWAAEDINMAVPLSPDELEQKKRAIFFHESRKNDVVYLGDDKREFWQRAEDRNKNTAETYNRLGLAHYEAMEAFHRHFL